MAPAAPEPARAAASMQPTLNASPYYADLAGAEDHSLIGWMLLPLKRYVDFEGRSRRKEYWLFTLLWWVVIALCFSTLFLTRDFATGGENGDLNPISAAGMMALVLWWLGTLLPCIALTVRRLHDQDKPGALVILFIVVNLFLSIFGWLLQTVFMCLPGTVGGNKYGPDPRTGVQADVFI